MNRRKFIMLASGAAIALPLSAHCQEGTRVPRIAFLTSTTPEDSPTGDALKQGLRELGYVEGRNIMIEWRSSSGFPERFPELVADVVRLNVDVIVAANNIAGLAAKRATSTIPIVMANIADPVGSGFAASIARPGGNVTGLATQAPDLQGKRLHLLKEAVPGLTRLAVVGDPTEAGYAPTIEELEVAARALGVEVRIFEIRKAGEFDGTFATVARQDTDGVMVVPSTVFFHHAARRALAEYALKYRLPMMCASNDYVRVGCLMSYFPSYADLYRRAAIYVDKILKGATPADLPIEQPTKFELVINLKTAKTLGLQLPDKLLALADEVIE
jgi:putative tryptophan/tyrosine transport system substrate-binding protein